MLLSFELNLTVHRFRYYLELFGAIYIHTATSCIWYARPFHSKLALTYNLYRITFKRDGKKYRMNIEYIMMMMAMLMIAGVMTDNPMRIY